MGSDRLLMFVDDVYHQISKRIWVERKGDSEDSEKILVFEVPKLNLNFAFSFGDISDYYFNTSTDPEYVALLIIERVKSEILQRYLYKHEILM